MKMAGMNNNVFKDVVSNWGILQPELGSQAVNSILSCAVLCANLKCSTLNLLPDEEFFICQMNKKKASCMEKQEVFGYPGSRMFQKKVIAYVFFAKWVMIPEHTQSASKMLSGKGTTCIFHDCICMQR
jgi:hypothetical protein